MINIKINTLRVKVIAFGAQSIIVMMATMMAVIIITASWERNGDNEDRSGILMLPR